MSAMGRPGTPLLTVDLIIEMADRPGRPIVIIERRNPPLGHALPGGFVDLGERLEVAAMREGREETGLDVTLTALLGCYSDPARDPRGHTVSAVYVGQAQGEPRAMDDAKALGIFDIDSIPDNMAFDHALILADYRRYRADGSLTPLRF